MFEELSKVLGEKQKIFSLLGRRDACEKLVAKAVSRAPLNLMGDHPNDGNVLCPPWRSVLVAVIQNCLPSRDEDLYDVLSTTVMHEGWCDTT